MFSENKDNIKFKLKDVRYNLRLIWNNFRHLFLSKNLYKKYENNIFIGRLYFSVTNICNAACVFCAYRYTIKNKYKGFMTFEIFKKALDDYIKLGGKKISFTPTVGDALLDPTLIKKIEYASKTKKLDYIYFYTNGIALLKNDLYKKLVDSGLHALEISTAGFDKDSYEKVYGVKIYEIFRDGVNALLKYNKKKGNKINININFRSPLLPSDTFKKLDFIKYIKPFLSKNVSFDFMPNYDNWGGTILPDDMIGVMKLRKIPSRNSTPCKRTFDAAVLFDGSVRLCACRLKGSEFDELVVGNIKDNTLSEIYYGENAKKVRERFVNNDHAEVCKGCSFYYPVTKKWIKERLKRLNFFENLYKIR